MGLETAGEVVLVGPGTAGFGRLLLRPHPGGSLSWARGTYQSVRDRAGAEPVSVAGYPGALGAQEAVFAVGSASHEFTGPALTAEFPDAWPPVMVVK